MRANGGKIDGLLSTTRDPLRHQSQHIGAPLFNLPHEQLCPGNDALQTLMAQFR